MLVLNENLTAKTIIVPICWHESPHWTTALAKIVLAVLNAYPERELRVNTSLDAINDQNDFYWQ